MPIPKNLRVPIIFGLLFEWLWSIFKVIPGIFKNLDVINVAGTGYYMTPLVLAAKFSRSRLSEKWLQSQTQDIAEVSEAP